MVKIKIRFTVRVMNRVTVMVMIRVTVMVSHDQVHSHGHSNNQGQ
jgi:hypothetical protein